MITTDANSVEMLKNNAKTIGGIMGAENAYLEMHQRDDEAFFLDKSTLDIQNITFK